MTTLTLPVETIDPTIFRTYDIRGIVNETLTPEVVFAVAQVVGSMVQEQGGKQVVFARDGRLSSPTLALALRDGILASGCDAIDLGLAPTPLLYYAAKKTSSFSGVMLTGSHNPPNYNGLKMVVNNHSVSEAGIQTIYSRIQKRDILHGKGSLLHIDCINEYINEISTTVKLKRRLKIVVDAGNGVAGLLAPMLYRQMGCHVHELYCEIDGRFPNHEADPSREENMQTLIQTVRDENADLGLAFDGDGDRVGIITNQGKIIWPDRLLMLYAKSLLHTHPKATIIFDVKCTNHLTSLIQSLGGEPMMWKTGHSLIKAKMAETNALLAGEMSGHFFFQDKWYGFDDGLYAGARLLEIIANQDLSCDDVFLTIPKSVNTPEIKIPVAEHEKFSLMEALKQSNKLHHQNVMTIDGVRIQFENGWGLIRPSNTTPYLILRFEAETDAAMQEIQVFFRDWLHAVKPNWTLPF